MKKNPSPLKATRLHCLACCLNQPEEVRRCGATGCPLHALRFGKSVPRIRPLKAIAEKCKDCAGDEQPKNCTLTDCVLHPFRTGKNPNRAGLCGKGAKNFQKPRESRKTPAHVAKTRRTHPKPDSYLPEEPCSEFDCLSSLEIKLPEWPEIEAYRKQIAGGQCEKSR